MNRIEIAELYQAPPADGSGITVAGWVRTVRDSKAFAFVEVNDGTSFRNLQVVCEAGLPNFDAVTRLTL